MWLSEEEKARIQEKANKAEEIVLHEMIYL